MHHSLGHLHPVTEVDGLKEGDKHGVDGADTASPHVKSPTGDPEIRVSNRFDLL